MRIKPGCIAEVVGYDRTPNDNGRYVKVVSKVEAPDMQRATNGEIVVFTPNGKEAWLVEVTERPLITHTIGPWRAEPVGINYSFARCYFAKNLRPISDPDIDVSETKEKEKPLEKVT